jgi:hypothetical protein
MDRIILDDIPFATDPEGLARLLRIQPGSRNASEFSKILQDAIAVARPKAAFAVAVAHMRGDTIVEIGNVILNSLILRINLEKAGIVYPFVATCGTELEEWSRTLRDMLHSFWADSIMLMALGCAMGHLDAYLKQRIGNEAILSSMNPGSLPDWPLAEQAALFSLLGDGASAIGARLTDKMVIHPLKSVSGIHFVSEEAFINCSLCPRLNCSSRRADYDTDLYGTKYGQQK